MLPLTRKRNNLFRVPPTLLAVTGALIMVSASANACESCGCEAKAKTALPVVHDPAKAHDHNHTHDADGHHVDHASSHADRDAILAMVGEFEVKFQFQETVAIEPGYELKDPYYSGATEFVEVVEDTGDYIALQHILVMHPKDEDGNLKEDAEPVVVKHWRQDWTYQDTELLTFRGDNTWERVELSPEDVAGTWTQAVYQVDDSPRYESYGKWVHLGDRSAWESAETWRPLPRREFSKRSDYQVLLAKNRHTITPKGWVHEQDNQKLVLNEAGEPMKILAHESGLNVYDRTDDTDFTAGRVYWEETSAYWQDVREIWEETFEANESFTLAKEIDGKKLYVAMFELASEVRDSGHSDATKEAAMETVQTYLASSAGE